MGTIIKDGIVVVSDNGKSYRFGNLLPTILPNQATTLLQVQNYVANSSPAAILTTSLTKAEIDALVVAGTFKVGVNYKITDAVAPAPQYVTFVDSTGAIINTHDRYTSEHLTFIKQTTRLSLASNDVVTTVSITDSDVDDVICTKIGDSYYRRVLFNDTINVKSFGTTGLGVIDEATTITAAVDSLALWFFYGATLFFPSGKYLVDSQITINKPLSIRGTEVMRYTDSGNFDFEAGSLIYTTSASGITVFSIESSRLSGATIVAEFRASSVESIHFKDASTTGYLSTLLQIKLTNNVKVRNCVFARGAKGVKCDANTEDASWCDFIGNVFAFNNTGFLNTTTTSSGVPTTFLTGGAFLVGVNQIGFQNDSATYVRLHETKFDVRQGGIGVKYISGGRSQLTDLNFELGPVADSNTIGILIDPSGSSAGLGGISITNPSITSNNSLGTGIKIVGGPSANFPTSRITIEGGEIAKPERGIWILTGCTSINIIGTNFQSSSVACIQMDSGSHNHQITSITNNVERESAGGIVDNSSGSVVRGYHWVLGGNRGKYDPYQKEFLIDNTQHSHTGDTVEATVYSGTIKAGSVGNNGMIDVDAIFSCTNSANNKTVRIKIGGFMVNETILVNSASIRINAFARWRNHASTVLRGHTTGGGFGVASTNALGSATISNTFDIAVLVTVLLANSGDTASLESIVVKGKY